MNFQVLSDLLRHHWVSTLFLLITLSTILLSSGIRWWWRRRWKRILEERFDQETELDALPPLSDKDRDALALIKEIRQEVWDLSENDLRLGVEVFSREAVRIVRSVAAIYHPEIESPEYEASLIESLQLVRRVTAKLVRLSAVTPIRFFGNQKLSDYQRYYQVYRKINENPILRKLKQHTYLYRIARWAMHIKNLGNPLYWAGREISREGYFFMLRWFYSIFIAQVGREAMRLYSGRRFQKEEDRDAVLICHRLFALTQQWGGPSPGEWAILTDFVTGDLSLEDDAKLHILSRWAQSRIPKDLEKQTLQTESGIKWYRKGLKRLLEDKSFSSGIKNRKIQEEMDSLNKPSEVQASESPQEVTGNQDQ